MSRSGRDERPQRERGARTDNRDGHGKDSKDQDLKDVLEEDAARGISRRPIDTDARRERHKQREKVRNAAYEIDHIEQWHQYMREELNLQEGTAQFEAAERAWMELKRKQHGG